MDSVFTEAEIRAVMLDHYPDDHTELDEAKCACGPRTVNRRNCFYCGAPVPENYRETPHKPRCKAEASGFQQMGTTMLLTPDFTADHLIEQLKEHREHPATAPR